MRKWTGFCVLSVVLATGSWLRAGICDDIHDLANRWNDLANFLFEHEEDGFDSREADQIDAIIQELIRPTRDLAALLLQEGNEAEVEMGRELMGWVRELEGRRRGDLVVYLTDVIDSIVDRLDEIVEFCDQASQPPQRGGSR